MVAHLYRVSSNNRGTIVQLGVSQMYVIILSSLISLDRILLCLNPFYLVNQSSVAALCHGIQQPIILLLAEARKSSKYLLEITYSTILNRVRVN